MAFPAGLPNFYKIIGLDVGYRGMEQRVRQQNLTFAGVSQDTQMEFDDLFIGARLGLGFEKDEGWLAYGASAACDARTSVHRRRDFADQPLRRVSPA